MAAYSERRKRAVKLSFDEEEDELSRPLVESANEQEKEDQEEEADEQFLLLVTSDLIDSHPNRSSPKGPSSAKKKIPEPATVEEVLSPKFPAAKRKQLAVHIKSSPVAPHSLTSLAANHDPFTMSSAQGRTRGRAPELQTPKQRAPRGRPPADVRIKTPKSLRQRESQRGSKSGTPIATEPRPRQREQRQIPDQSQVQESKKRRREILSPDSIREQYLETEPDYTPFKCEWDTTKDPGEGKLSICPAELHNIDTLRRHVYFVHGEAEPLTCRFSKCNSHNPPLRFKTFNEFEHHMEKQHFSRYLWHMGDGYQNNGIWTVQTKPGELPAYLFDELGNQVTPSVLGQQVESEVELRKRKRRLKTLLWEQNEKAPSDEEWRRQLLGLE